MRNIEMLESLFRIRGHKITLTDYHYQRRGWNCVIKSPGIEDSTLFLPDYAIEDDSFWYDIHKLTEGDK